MCVSWPGNPVGQPWPRRVVFHAPSHVREAAPVAHQTLSTSLLCPEEEKTYIHHQATICITTRSEPRQSLEWTKAPPGP
jgi:hypothetical protein